MPSAFLPMMMQSTRLVTSLASNTWKAQVSEEPLFFSQVMYEFLLAS